jgi:antitoxin HicB
MEFGYPFTISEENGEFLVSFPDVPEALTSGASLEEARVLAADALLAALGGYMDDRRTIPTPSLAPSESEVIYLQPLHAAKIALYIAMLKEEVTNVIVAKRLDRDEKEIRRMLDLDHCTKIETINHALQQVFSSPYRLVTSLQTNESKKSVGMINAA